MRPLTTFDVTAADEHAVLGRILLAFSRRRLRIRSLNFDAGDGQRAAHLRIEAECAGRAAREVLGQLRRIVEVIEVDVAGAQAPAGELSA